MVRSLLRIVGCIRTAVWAVVLVAGSAAVGSGATPEAVRLDVVDPVSVPPEIRLPDTPPVYAVRTVQQPPKIDGKLDDPAWQGVPPMGRMFLDSGEGAMRYKTIARIVRDEKYLYVAVDCLHPKISDVKVVKGVRDRVAYQGETVELFLHTDRSIRDYVHVIFDMSGAFTDQRVYNPGEEGRTSDTKPLDFEWNGDIVAAADVGGTGWRLESRIRIADLAVGGEINPHVWGANIARNSRSQSGSWARIVGRYHQPEAFGLLTMCDGPVAVDDISVGALSCPDEKETASVVHLRLRNLQSAGQSAVAVHLTATGSKKHKLVESTQKVVWHGSDACDVLSVMDLKDETSLHVMVETAGRGSLFDATLPIVRKPRRSDIARGSDVTCAVRPIRSVAFNPAEAKVYLLAWANPGASAKASGRLGLVSKWSDKNVWRVPVTMDLPEGGLGSALVSLPADVMTDGQYQVRWVPDEKAASQEAAADVEYGAGGRGCTAEVSDAAGCGASAQQDGLSGAR